MSRFPLIATELWETQGLFAMLCEIIHLSLQRAQGNSYPALPAKSNSRISQRRNWERVFTRDANGAFKQSGNHSLLHRHHQHMCFFLHPTSFPVTAERGGLNIRGIGQCPKLPCHFSLILNWGFTLFHSNCFIDIAWHMNGNSMSLW